YDGTNGRLVAWVRVPFVSKDSNTTIYMYYGNSCITSSQQNAAGVWDQYYEGVWHLKESGNGTLGEYGDSTSNTNDGQGGAGASGETPTRITTLSEQIISYGQRFDGNDDFIKVPHHATID
ncbi:MAG: DUF2341 domain-containing protein, partial [Deltaproteobacteria bacterium]|nr:DUF2341 domain-containing protein [Deltaproteobacteria bacterium]